MSKFKVGDRVQFALERDVTTMLQGKAVVHASLGVISEIIETTCSAGTQTTYRVRMHSLVGSYINSSEVVVPEGELVPLKADTID